MKISDELVTKITAMDSFGEIGKDHVVHCHFFNPDGIGDWYGITCDVMGDDILFHGIISLETTRLGFFELKELIEMTLPSGQKVVADNDFVPVKAGELSIFKYI